MVSLSFICDTLKTVATKRSLRENRHDERPLDERATGERDAYFSAIYHAQTIARINLPEQNCNLYERSIAKYKHHKFSKPIDGIERQSEGKREKSERAIIETIYSANAGLRAAGRGGSNLIDLCIFIRAELQFSEPSNRHLSLCEWVDTLVMQRTSVASSGSFSRLLRRRAPKGPVYSLTNTEKARLLNRSHEKWRFRVTSASQG